MAGQETNEISNGAEARRAPAVCSAGHVFRWVRHTVYPAGMVPVSKWDEAECERCGFRTISVSSRGGRIRDAVTEGLVRRAEEPKQNT